jgi:uncharacterized membrane protein
VAAFTVWQFDSADGADAALGTLEHVNARAQIEDAALVSWPQEARTPTTRQLPDLAGAGTLGGTFWGFLFGLVFFVPLLGIAGGPIGDTGIDDTFIKDVRKTVTPGTSALFLLTPGAAIDSISEELEGARHHATLLHSTFLLDVPTAA